MKMSVKTFYVVKEALRKNGWIDLPADGTSMFPLIQKGNVCCFVSCKAAELKKGDVVLFQTSSDQLVAHRFLGSVANSNQIFYLFKGDTNLGPDDPVSSDKIIGKLVSIKKGKTMIYAAGVLFFFWRRLILAFPLTSSFLRTYLTYKETKK